MALGKDFKSGIVGVGGFFLRQDVLAKALDE